MYVGTLTINLNIIYFGSESRSNKIGEPHYLQLQLIRLVLILN